MGTVVAGSVVAADLPILQVTLLPLDNVALGVSPAIRYDAASKNISLLVGGTGLNYDTGLRTITLQFTLTNPGTKVTASGETLRCLPMLLSPLALALRTPKVLSCCLQLFYS